MKTRKFCILTTARSGSNALVSLLRLVPDTICHGELFSISGVWSALRPDLEIPWSVDTRNQNPLVFLADVERRTLALAGTCGFKLFIEHNRRVRRHVFASGEYSIIWLSRANKLAQFASLAVAESSGVWHSRQQPSPQAAQTAHFDLEGLNAFLEKAERQDAIVKRGLDRHRTPCFALEYRDIKNGRVVDELGAFLGVDPGVSLSALIPSIPHVKQGSSAIIERFSNPEDVVSAMRAMGHEDWLMEEDLHSHV